jgi:hypothetical protein
MPSLGSSYVLEHPSKKEEILYSNYLLFSYGRCKTLLKHWFYFLFLLLSQFPLQVPKYLYPILYEVLYCATYETKYVSMCTVFVSILPCYFIFPGTVKQ